MKRILFLLMMVFLFSCNSVYFDTEQNIQNALLVCRKNHFKNLVGVDWEMAVPSKIIKVLCYDIYGPVSLYVSKEEFLRGGKAEK